MILGIGEVSVSTFREFFPNFKANVSTCFPAIFRLPRTFPAGYSCPTRSTLTSQGPRITTSRPPWRQFGDNFPHFELLQNRAFFGVPEGPRTLGADPIFPNSTPIHFPTPTRHITTVSRAPQNFSTFRAFFSRFQGKCFHVFPGHFSAPTDLPGRLFLPHEVHTYFPKPKDHDQPTALATIWRYFPHLSYSKIGPFLGSPRALGPLGPTQYSQIQLPYTSQHQPDTSQPFPGPHKMFPLFGHFFPNFKANVFTCFPAIFRLPRTFPAGYSCPTRSTLTSPSPRITTSRPPWRQFGDNFPHLSYFKIGPFLGSPRALGPLGPTQSS